MTAHPSDGFWDNVTEDDLRKYLQADPIARRHMPEESKTAATSPMAKPKARPKGLLCCGSSSQIDINDTAGPGTENDATALARGLLAFSVMHAEDASLQDNVSVVVVLFGTTGASDGESKAGASGAAEAATPGPPPGADGPGWEDVWWDPVASFSMLAASARAPTAQSCSRMRRAFDGVTGVCLPCDASASGVASP